MVTISGKRAFEIIAMNKKGMKPDNLQEAEERQEPKKATDLLEQESVTRFDRGRNHKEGNNASRNRKKKKGGIKPVEQIVENGNHLQNSESNKKTKDNRPVNNNRNRQSREQSNKNRQSGKEQNIETGANKEQKQEQRKHVIRERSSKAGRNVNHEEKRNKNNEKSVQE